MARVIELVSYPIKGCAGTSLPETTLAEAGLAHDRSFMVVGEDGEFRTQRRDPVLALVRPRIDEDGRSLALSAPGVEPVRIPVDLDAPRRDVVLFGKPYRGIDQGEVAAEWFSAVLGAPARLVRVPSEHDRVTDGETPGTAGYADGHAVLVASPGSLDLLNGRIAETGGEPLPMNRFRPNIVVGGWPRPHTEDLVRRIGIGAYGAELGYAKVCIRCAVTMVDQETGVPSGPEPIRTLAGYRRAFTGVAFGAKFAVTRPGQLAVGDEVHVTSWGESAA